jgi:hypothetical protein
MEPVRHSARYHRKELWNVDIQLLEIQVTRLLEALGW